MNNFLFEKSFYGTFELKRVAVNPYNNTEHRVISKLSYMKKNHFIFD